MKAAEESYHEEIKMIDRLDLCPEEKEAAKDEAKIKFLWAVEEILR